MRVTYRKVGFAQYDMEREAELNRMVKSGLRKCKGHKKLFGLRAMFDDDTIKGRLYEEQCVYCGGYME